MSLAATSPRVVFLGTGGALNAERYQASVLVEAGSTRVLLDTGGGLGVVRRLLAAGVPPATVNHVFLSHRHLDHVGGLEPFLLWVAIRAQQKGETPPPLRLYASPETMAAVRATLRAAHAAGQRRFGSQLTWVSLLPGQSAPLGYGQSLTLVPAAHLPAGGGASGCVLDLDGRRIAYSGDTLPTRELARAAQGADLLIHEVGGLDAQAAYVHRPCHSTAQDAARVAAEAGATSLALFHVPAAADADPDELLAEAQSAAPAVRCFVAEDGQELTIG